MLRIKTQESQNRITMALEGDLSGVWVCEFFNTWRDANRILGQRALLVDLTGVVRVDKAGEYLLALIRRSGSKLTGSGLVIGSLLESIASDWPLAAVNPQKEVPTGR